MKHYLQFSDLDASERLRLALSGEQFVDPF